MSKTTASRAGKSSNYLRQILSFLEAIDEFKSVYRVAYIGDRSRHESDAEHTWHTCMFALLLYQELQFDVRIDHALELILVHDLVEIHAGDTYAYDADGHTDKSSRESAAAQRLFSLLPNDHAARFRGWWEEFEAGEMPEARFAKAIDKMQALAQNVFTGGRVWRERGVTEVKSRSYNTSAMEVDPSLRAAFEMLYERASEEGLWSSSENSSAQSNRANATRGKLVRDRIPEIVRNSGLSCKASTMSENEYRQALREKLVEEAVEVSEAGNTDMVNELADLREVMDALMRTYGIDGESVSQAQQSKRDERGGFAGRIRLEWDESR